jgi:hypothetical protein
VRGEGNEEPEGGEAARHRAGLSGRWPGTGPLKVADGEPGLEGPEGLKTRGPGLAREIQSQEERLRASHPNEGTGPDASRAAPASCRSGRRKRA